MEESRGDIANAQQPPVLSLRGTPPNIDTTHIELPSVPPANSLSSILAPSGYHRTPSTPSCISGGKEKRHVAPPSRSH